MSITRQINKYPAQSSAVTIATTLNNVTNADDFGEKPSFGFATIMGAGESAVNLAS